MQEKKNIHIKNAKGKKVSSFVCLMNAVVLKSYSYYIPVYQKMVRKEE